MKRFEKWNELEGKSDSAEVQAVGMIVAEILDNTIKSDIDENDEDYKEPAYNKENKDEVVNVYMKKFTGIVSWMNEEEEK